MSDYEGEDRQDESLSNSDVVSKYKVAARIVNDALATVVAAAKPGVKIADLCILGDKLIEEATGKEFKGKDVEKGVAIPTSVSSGTAIGHFSPGPEDETTLVEGELVRVELGAHIDGFIAQAATTSVVGGGPATGEAADVLAAARDAFELASRLARAGGSSEALNAAVRRSAETYGAQLVEGVASHEVKRFIVDGAKAFVPRPPADQGKPKDFETEAGEAYAIDVVVTSGEGRPRVLDEKATTVYRRALDAQYQLKIKASREVFSEVSRRFPTVLFATRSLSASRSRYGLVECVNHGLLTPYPVLHERPGAVVAHIKGTVLLTPSGVDRITDFPLPEIQTDKKLVDEDLIAKLAEPLNDKKSKKKKKSAKAAAPQLVQA